MQNLPSRPHQPISITTDWTVRRAHCSLYSNCERQQKPKINTIRALKQTVIALLLIPSLLISGSKATTQALPELSDTSAQFMNSAQEKIFGKQVMLNIRASSHYSDDVLLLDYFNTLTANIAIHSPRDFGKTTTSLAVNTEINAFAVPGGYISINTGLMDNAHSVDELASVIAHELGHQSQRHIARSIERSKQLTIPTAAAMIGGLLIGGQLGTAALLGSQAAAGADRLAYSRKFEREADTTGMKMLADSGYDPEGMPAFFGQLERRGRLYGGIMPEFLKTHPVTLDRIADARSRAARLTPAPNIAKTPPDRLDFISAKARTRALYSQPLDTVIAELKLASLNEKLSPETRQAASYGLSIAMMRNNDFKGARAVLDALLSEKPQKPIYKLAEAELASKAGNSVKAEQLYQALYDTDKLHPAYSQGYAAALVQNSKYAMATRILRKTLRHSPDTLWAYDSLAQAYAADGKAMNARLTRAQMLKKMGLFARALDILHQTRSGEYADASEYLRARIDDLIKQTEQEKQQMENFKL